MSGPSTRLVYPVYGLANSAIPKQELAPIALMPCKFEEELLANGSGSIGVEHLHPRSATGID